MQNYFWPLQLTSFHDQSLDFFTLSDVEKEHIQTKHGNQNQLMYGLLLKYFECDGRFADPEITTKTHPQVVKFLAGQLNVSFIKIE